MFDGYWLDNYNFIGLFQDKNNEINWYLITSKYPKDKEGNITLPDNVERLPATKDKPGRLIFKPSDDDILTMTQINPSCFEWQGKKFSLKLESKGEEK